MFYLMSKQMCLSLVLLASLTAECHEHRAKGELRRHARVDRTDIRSSDEAKQSQSNVRVREELAMLLLAFNNVALRWRPTGWRPAGHIDRLALHSIKGKRAIREPQFRSDDMLQRSARITDISMQPNDEGKNAKKEGLDKAVDDLKDGANKGVWFATEMFGKAAAAVRGTPSSVSATPGTAPASLKESISRLQADYEGTSDDPRPYFLTGRMDEMLYDVDCEFADPFVSFNGRQRFKDNLENLAGGFIIDSSTRTLETCVDDGDPAAGVPPSYTTKLMVKLQLGLPWKPVLAWPWGVKHIFDASTGLIVQHIESWDVSAGEGVRQLLRPGPKRGIGKGSSDGG